MSALVIRLSYPRAPHFDPLHIYPNLSISRELFWNPTPVVCHKLRRCHARTYNKNQDVQAQQLVFTTDFMTPRSSLPQNNYFLTTYQTCHHYHGDNKANHNYDSYKQAGPVPRAMKVNMIMSVIMVITNCFIPILYYGFVHGCCSWAAKQANCSKPQSLYTLAIPRTPSSSSSHCFTQYLMTSHTCCLTIWIPPDSYNNSLTLTGFVTAECFWQRTILKWPPEMNSTSITLPVHGFGVLYVRHSSCYLLIQRIL